MYEYEDDDIPLELDIVPTVYAAARSERYDYGGQQQAAAFSQVKGLTAALPEEVKKFIMDFHRNLLEHSVYELHYMYENLFNKITERHYAKSSWPEPEVIAPLVKDDSLFLILYRELYFRHIYSKLQPTLNQRIQSYENYCDLFNYILNSDGPVTLELPNQWMWDIIDEFIYQFQTFCHYRNKHKNKNEEEVEILKNNGNVWSSYGVLNVLYSLISKSKINEQLELNSQQDESSENNAVMDGSAVTANEYAMKPLYKMLGFFSIIGLLRVHSLLGNYIMGLKMLDSIDLTNKKSLYTKVTACHVTIYYYVGFCYLMLRRYSDAIKCFSHILVFLLRTKNYHTKSYQFDQINKKMDQMYALLAICNVLFPTRLDENVHNLLREKYSDHMHRMRQIEQTQPFEELFMYACPKFITPSAQSLSAPGSADTVDTNITDPYHHQLNIFLGEVRRQVLIPTLRSYLGLYTRLSISKLASFLDIKPDELRAQLMILKQKSRQKKWVKGSLLSGTYEYATDIDFYIKGDMIHITEQKLSRRYEDWFVRNINKFDDIIVNLNHIKH